MSKIGTEQNLGKIPRGNVDDICSTFNKININDSDSKGVTPLHVAAKWARVGLVDDFFEKGADLEAKTKQSKLTPLLYISQSSKLTDEHVEFAKNLLAVKADVNSQNISGETALWGAIHRGSLKFIELLVDNGIDTKIEDETGQTAAIFAQKNSSDPEIVKYLQTFPGNELSKNIYEQVFRPFEPSNVYQQLQAFGQTIDKNADDKKDFLGVSGNYPGLGHTIPKIELVGSYSEYNSDSDSD